MVMKRFPLITLLLTILVLPSSPALEAKNLARNESETAIPGLSYGEVKNLPKPKTIFFGANIDNIIADAEKWKRRGIDAFFVDGVAREWSTDIWAADGKAWTIGASDETLQKAKEAAAICKKVGSETFLKIAFDHHLDWFDEITWQRANNNFRQFAIFAREAGFDGIALDIEYINKQYAYDWEGYDYSKYTRKDLVKKIEERATRILQVLYEEFPDMIFFTFPEQGLGMGAHIQKAWIEEAARQNAPGGIHYCTEYTYRHANINYMFGHIWGCQETFRRILSEKAWAYWLEKCSIVSGLWPFSSDDYRVYGPGIPFAELKQGLAATLMTSPRYNWIYGSYTQEQLIGRDLDKYDGDEDIHAHLEALAKKEMVTDKKWIRLAQELRAGVLRDYSKDFGVVPLPVIVGPKDDCNVDLVPVSSSMPVAKGPAYDRAWMSGLQIFNGEELNLKEQYGTRTDWMVIGPFPNDQAFSGHVTVYPPEKEIDLNGEYEGLDGTMVQWKEHHQQGALTSVDFKQIFTPTENVCAYAYGTVTSPEEKKVQLRIGTNDSGKMWVNGALVFDYPHDGRVTLDRNIIPCTLPKGTSRILIKVCNARLDWGFVFRITNEDGSPTKGLKFGLD
ncbi:MAG: hypothetical protein L3K26_15755 [Candidatus Hydrogenedentes bacterium]|nr:hypothetical protein [Candidatus Hydrogenedentota bacterium]